MDGFETAVFGGGCFWCMEEVFLEVKGVVKVESGYAGGVTDDPTYEDVCSGRTGHAEVVRVTYDPRTISYVELLAIFFAMHDPTSKDRQGADVGSQYRSIILYADEGQKTAAERAIEQLDRALGKRVMTEIKPLKRFYKAEDYHDKYYRNHPHQPYCALVVRPKLAKLRRMYSGYLSSP